jgi:hypothetical protein
VVPVDSHVFSSVRQTSESSGQTGCPVGNFLEKEKKRKRESASEYQKLWEARITN